MAIRRLLGLAAAATLLLSASAFIDSPATCGDQAPSWWPNGLAHAKDLKTLFQADREACFGRVYDSAHLKSHPQQKVTSIHIFRSLDDRKEAENWTPGRKQEQIEQFNSENPNILVDAFVQFRDRKGNFYNGLQCHDYEGGVMCGIDCDGGSFVLNPANAGSLMLKNNGFVLIGGCGEDVSEADTVYFSPGKDDKVFRLDRKPVEACRAEQQKTVPIRLGQGLPLRERFKPDEPFCYGRDYDTAHMAKNPQQKVASIRVGRLDPSPERKADGVMAEREWPSDVRVHVSMKLKAGNKKQEANYSCDPEVSNWRCTMHGAESKNATCVERYFHLARNAGDNISLINRRDGLPIEFACPDERKSDNAGEDIENRKTQSDDVTFRLNKMPLEACR